MARDRQGEADMFFKARRQNRIIARLEAVLACANFSVSDDGVMSIQPTNAMLDATALRTVARMVRSACADSTIREVNIDLSNVSEVGPQWTVMFASLMELARTVNAKCRIVGLNGKTADAASLYRNSLELSHLLGMAA